MRVIASLVLAASVVLGAGPGSAAIGPTDELRQYTDRVLEVLRAPNLSPAERRTAVRNLAIEVFDVEETAKRALGAHWQPRTPTERSEFVKLFRDLIEQTYISRIDEYGGERIQYTGERVDGDTAVVRAQILTKAGTTVPVESRLSLRNDRWLIYDILIENVSLVANYRSQFDRIIRTSSYDDLVKRLRDRVAQLNQGVIQPARAGKPDTR
jgi:phospholipid transport system substrate-binding protein